MIKIYYDGECPFCSQYVRYLRLRESFGQPQLVDLRDDQAAKAALEAEGFDLDKGMVVDLDGQRYGGADAVHVMAAAGTSSGLFNKINVWLFSRPVIAKLTYPLMRAGRNATLFFLGRQALSPPQEEQGYTFTLFSLFFALFGILRFLYIGVHYEGGVIEPTGYVIFLLSVALFFNPESRRVFAVLLPVYLIDAFLQMPVTSNHTMLKDMVIIALSAAGLWHLLKGSHWETYLRDALPVCRFFLLVMYFFGAFHKINTGFLSPESSCAVTLWKMMPFPLPLLQGAAFYHFIIYGTLVVESALIVMLLLRATRYWAIIGGIAFHVLLALSGYIMYAVFSTLAIALHLLFISPTEAKRVIQNPIFQRLMKFIYSFSGWILFALWFVLLFTLAMEKDYSLLGMVWAALVVPFIALTLFLIRGKEAVEEEGVGKLDSRHLIWSRLPGLNVLSVFFFLNCAMPYAGLKTSQAMNMYANLRLEGGVSNHLIFKSPPGPFGYLEDVVELKATTAGGKTYESGIRLVYYDLLNRMERSPELSFSYIRDGITYEEENAATRQEDIDRILHPRWFRLWFHFKRVMPLESMPCH